MADLLTLVTVVPAMLASPPAAQAQADRARAEALGLTVKHTTRHIATVEATLDDIIAVSPDGDHYIALQTRPDPIIWMVPRSGDPFTFRADWAAYRPRWSPSGDRVGFIAGIGLPRIWTVEVDLESARALDPPRMLVREGANAFAFSPDGRRIALVEMRSTAGGASEIRLIDWESRRSVSLLRELGVIYWLDWSPDGAYLYYGLIPPASLADPNPRHLLRRAPAAGGVTRTLGEVGEFLGLSADGSRILYRPASNDPSPPGTTYEIAPLAGGDAVRFSLDGPAPRWGADESTLIQVRRTGEQADVVEIRVGSEL